MKFGIFYELQLPRPWGPDDERMLYQNALSQVSYRSITIQGIFSTITHVFITLVARLNGFSYTESSTLTGHLTRPISTLLNSFGKL